MDKVDLIPNQYAALTKQNQTPETLTPQLLAKEPVFYTQNTLIAKPTTTGFTGLTSYGEADKIRWQVTEDSLIARQSYEFVKNAPGGAGGIGQDVQTGDVVGDLQDLVALRHSAKLQPDHRRGAQRPGREHHGSSVVSAPVHARGLVAEPDPGLRHHLRRAGLDGPARLRAGAGVRELAERPERSRVPVRRQRNEQGPRLLRHRQPGGPPPGDHDAQLQRAPRFDHQLQPVPALLHGRRRDRLRAGPGHPAHGLPPRRSGSRLRSRQPLRVAAERDRRGAEHPALGHGAVRLLRPHPHRLRHHAERHPRHRALARRGPPQPVDARPRAGHRR